MFLLVWQKHDVGIDRFFFFFFFESLIGTRFAKNLMFLKRIISATFINARRRRMAESATLLHFRGTSPSPFPPLLAKVLLFVRLTYVEKVQIGI